MSRWSQPWRPTLVVVVALVVFALGAVSFVRRVGTAVPGIGVEWVRSSAGPIALHVDPSGNGARAGLAAGDRLIAVNGEPVSSTIDAAELVWMERGHGGIQVRVDRGGEGLSLAINPDWRLRSEPYLYLVIVGLAFWTSGLFIAIRWPTIRAGTIYALLAGCLSLHLALSHTGAADALDWMIYWGDIVAGALWPALLLHVGVAMTKRTLRRPDALLGVAYSVALAGIAAAVWLSPAAAGGAYRFTDPLRAVELRDRAEILVAAIAVIFTAVLLAKSHAGSPSRMHRSQTRWLIWGLSVGFGPFVLLYAVPWALGAAELPDWARFFSVLPMLLVPAAFTAALARYRLADLDLFLLRGFSEVTAVFFTFAVLSATVFLLREGVGEMIPLSRSATRYVGFLVAAVAYPQLRSWVRTLVERAFYRRRYSYRATLLDWARELATETDLISLIERLRHRVRDTLGVPEAEVLVRTGPWRFDTVGGPDGRGVLELDEASLEQLDRDTFLALEPGSLDGVPWARYLFSMKVKDRLRAVLAVADRPDHEEPLNRQDRALLGTLAAHAGTAIEAARLVLEVRQRAEEIERLHARQGRILESSAVGLLLLDGDGKILDANRALEEIYAMPRQDVIGHRLGEVFPLQVARRIELEGLAAKGGEEARIFRLNMVNHADQRRVLNVAISPAGDDGGRVVTFDDVTERVGLEQQVLQQERLASLGLLAAGVAHEINTPLTGISSYTQMLLEDESDEASADPARRSVLEKIERQTRRASNITNSLLTLARPERTVYETLDLNETIREALQLFQPQVRGRQIRLDARLDDSLPPVRGHRGKLHQVLLNLLLNARDAVQHDGEIRVVTRRAGNRVLLEISDSGGGIPDEDLPRIFDPFFTTKGRGKGTGLGLSITYGVVQEHDGTIRADSDREGLTRFTIELPALSGRSAVARG